MKTIKLNHKKIVGELNRLGWTFARLAREIGISKQRLSYHIRNKTVDPEIIGRIAKVFNLDPKDLIKVV